MARVSLPLPAILRTGVVGSTALVLASLLIGRLAPTRGASSLLWLHHLRDARVAAIGLQATGLTLLTVAWWQLGRHVRGHPDGVRTAVRATWRWATPLLLVPPMFSNDVWSYVADGELVARHADPYVVPPVYLTGPITHAVSARWLHTPAPYGPLPLWWGGVCARLTGSPWLQLYGMRAFALIGLGLLALAVPALARACGADPARAAWLAVASPFTLAHGVLSAHVDLLVAGLGATAVLVAVRRHPVAATLLLGVAASVKFPVILIALPVALAGRPERTPLRRTSMRVAGVVGGAATVVWILGVVSGLGLGWITALSAPLSSHTPLALVSDLAVLLGGPRDRTWTHAFGILGLLVVAALALALLLRHRGWTPPRVNAAAAGLLVAELVLGPVVHQWYFFGCLPFLASGAWPRRVGRVVVAVTLILGLLAVDDLSLRLPYGEPVLVLGVAASCLAGIDRPRRACRFWRRHPGGAQGRPTDRSASVPTLDIGSRHRGGS